MEKNKERNESRQANVVADAVVTIVVEKLKKLSSTQEVCLALKLQVTVVISKLQVVYEFLIDQCWKESHPEWMDRLLRALYDAEDEIDIFMWRIVDQDQETVKIVPDVLKTLWWKYSLHRGMNEFTKEVDGLLQDQHLEYPLRGVTTQSRPIEGQYYDRWRRVNSDREDRAEIGTYRVQSYKNVRQQLLQGGKDLCGVAIYGEEGAGKSYLARRIFNQSDIRRHFEVRAWVHITPGLTLKDIRYAVLKQVKGPNKVLKNIDHEEEDYVKQSLLQELGDKRYLVVLDDFCDRDIWYKFIRYLPEWMKGSRVLVTTRDNYTARVVQDYHTPIEFKKLNQDECGELLKKKVSPVIPNLQQKEIDQIFKWSNGSPLAVGLLGGLLMHDRLLTDIDKANLPEILMLSYNRLPREEKPCFLHLTLFPRGRPIPVRRIIRLWLGEGLLIRDDLGEKYLEDLILRNLVEVASWSWNGTPKTCQVVTSLHDMFRPQAIELGLLHIFDKEMKDAETEATRFRGRQFNVRWLAEYSNSKSFFQSNPELIKRMRSFVSFYPRKGTLTKDFGAFLRTMSAHNHYLLLRVLDLEGVYKPYLHETIGQLVLLRYLGLRSTVLDFLPESVGDLPQLETLDIKNTNITVLPVSLWKSSRLRHLYLNGFHVDPAILKRYTSSGFLSNLQTLVGLYIGTIDENLLNALIASLTKLTNLKINYQSSEKQDSIARWISKLTNLQSFKLGITKKDSTLPNLILPEHHHLFDLYLLGKLPKLEASQLPSSLRSLTLSKSQLSVDPMHSLGQLQRLRTLKLLSNSYTGQEMKCLAKAFPHLQVLKIWSLTELRKFTVEEGSMSNLRELEIRDCPKLTFQETTGLERLASLEELTLRRMPKAFVEDARKKLENKCCIFSYNEVQVQEGGKGGSTSSLPQGNDPQKKESSSRDHPGATILQKIDHKELMQEPITPKSHNEEESISRSSWITPDNDTPEEPPRVDQKGTSFMGSREQSSPTDHDEEATMDQEEPSAIGSPTEPGGGHRSAPPAGPLGGGGVFATPTRPPPGGGLPFVMSIR